MPAYNFKKQFAEKVRSGKKRQTIRLKRKRPTRVGDALYLFTGQRTKGCERLGKAICMAVRPVDVYQDRVVLEGETLSRYEAEAFAMADGFLNFQQLCDFFSETYGLPMVGRLEVICW